MAGGIHSLLAVNNGLLGRDTREDLCLDDYTVWIEHPWKCASSLPTAVGGSQRLCLAT